MYTPGGTGKSSERPWNTRSMSKHDETRASLMSRRLNNRNNRIYMRGPGFEIPPRNRPTRQIFGAFIDLYKNMLTP